MRETHREKQIKRHTQTVKEMHNTLRVRYTPREKYMQRHTHRERHIHSEIQ